MKQKFLIWVVPAFFLLFTFTGCGKKTDGGAITVLPMTNMEFELADASGITVYDFNLGYMELTALDGELVSAPLSGIIAAPDSAGPYPLVVLFHGRTDTESVHDKIYAGFDYLVRQLAAQGYVALSINVVSAYDLLDYDDESLEFTSWAYSLFEQHLARLFGANNGQDMGHGVNLTGKVNIEQIHLIGHSMGGAIADGIARRETAEGNKRVRSLIRVGTQAHLYDAPPPDLPTGIILAEFDADMPEQPGQSVFDEILESSHNKSFASLVYLRGANHNFFNRAFTEDDRDDEYFFVAQMYQETWLTREQQENFIMNYAAAFLSVVTQKREPWGVFNPGEPQPVSLFGFNVTASTYIPALSEIFFTERKTTGAAAANYVQHTEGGFFNHPDALNRYDDGLELISLAWTGKDGAVTFTPSNRDFSGYQAVSLYMAVDSSNELTSENQDQAFSFILKDTFGKQQKITIPAGTSALAFHPGLKIELPEDMIEDMLEAFDIQPEQDIEDLSSFILDIMGVSPWQGSMPLGELRIPLSCFGDVNLSSVNEITIAFDQTSSGAVMLSHIFLLK